jgi:hypothetical protein
MQNNDRSWLDRQPHRCSGDDGDKARASSTILETRELSLRPSNPPVAWRPRAKGNRCLLFKRDLVAEVPGQTPDILKSREWTTTGMTKTTIGACDRGCRANAGCLGLGETFCADLPAPN